MTLQFGMWDSFERITGIPPGDQYEQRIRLVREAEELGLYGYHLAEHHLSPLSMAPSPLMFLTALSQRTSVIRLGSMVTILPLYPSVRLTEEICMLDALSRGRLEFGVGRGIRDAEHEWFGQDPTETHASFSRALEVIRAALISGKIDVGTSDGAPEFVPLVHEPTQRPTPRFWYVGNMDFAADEGMSVLARRPSRREVDTYWSTWRAKRDAGSPLHQGPEPLIGATRPTFVARTDEEAERIVARSWSALGENFWATETRSGGRTLPRGASAGSFGGGDFHHALDNGDLVYGSAARVAELLSAFLTSAGPGFNYLVSSFQWGDLSHDEASESLSLFATEVIPVLKEHHGRLD